MRPSDSLPGSYRLPGFVVATALLTLAACGGGGADPAANQGNADAAATETGTLIDSAVAGLGYRTATQSGTTDAGGQFAYRPGETVTFFVGDVSLPPIGARATITPFHIAGSSDSNDPIALNIASFLQSLDTDGDPANGITIPAGAGAVATGGIDFNVPTATFAQNSHLIALVRDANPGGRTPVDAATARAHLLQTVGRLGGADRPNLAPIARISASADTIQVGQGVTLSGSQSEDPNGDTLTYRWTLGARPAGSQIVLPDASTVQVDLTPDVAGTYVASLVVGDGALDSTATTVDILVTDPPSPPPAALTGLTIVQPPAVMAVGGTHALAATAAYSNGSNFDVTTQAAWSSSNDGVLSVNAGTGQLTAVSAGSAQISAGFEGATAQVTVQVVELGAPTAHAPVSSADSGAGDGKVRLAWTPVAGAASYNVYWVQDGMGVTTASNRIEDVQSNHEHSGLAAASYAYRVAAVLGNVEALSNEVFSTVYAPGPASGTFGTVPGLTSLGFGASVTLLDNGKVLIAGKRTNPTAPASLYDPVANELSPIAISPLGIGDDAAAARLDDGKVFITGGWTLVGGSFDVKDTTLIYDPTLNTFIAGPTLPTPLYQHTATTLADGRVLIAGGGSAQTTLFDPVTSTFTNGPSMSGARTRHAAVRLRDGRVLLVGGTNDGSTDLFDPSDDSMAPGGTLLPGAATYAHATLLGDGRVMVIASGDVGSPAVSVQIFDPQSGTFSAGATLDTPRIAPAVTTLADGSVLIAGGNDGSTVTQNAEAYDPANDQSAATGQMPASNTFLRSTILRDGRVAIHVGGQIVVYQP